MSSNVFVKSGRVLDLVNGENGVTSNITGDWKFKDAPKAAIQAIVQGTGTVGATVTLQVSNDGINAISTALGVITLTGTTVNSDGFTTDAPWKYIRAVITGITGTGATVFVRMSV